MTQTDEAMVCLAEECGELAQAAMKIVRFGESAEARTRLEQEIGDVLCLIKWMTDTNLVHEKGLEIALHNKRRKLMQYSNLYDERGEPNMERRKEVV